MLERIAALEAENQQLRDAIEAFHRHDHDQEGAAMVWHQCYLEEKARADQAEVPRGRLPALRALEQIEIEYLTPLARFIQRSRVKPTDGQIEHVLGTVAKLRERLRPICAEWQPIETAPKMTYVLLWDGTSRFIGVWHTAVQRWGYRGEPLPRQPTHWMPLPEPPSTELLSSPPGAPPNER